jgi:hypothetical protein
MRNYAMPSKRLKRLWSEWIDLHNVLSSGKRKNIQTPAAPFFSASSKVKCKSRILLVGKATDRDWYGKEYQLSIRRSKEDAIHDRLHRNRYIVQTGGNRKSFWQFFDRLASVNQEIGRDSVVWSNIAKIGSLIGNPSGLLLSIQADLAERTLRAEIEEYDPKVIIFVTGTNECMDRIIMRTLGVPRDLWIRSEKEDRSGKIPDVWWTGSRPLALWTRHPQGAKAQEIEYWVKKLRELGKL